MEIEWLKVELRENGTTHMEKVPMSIMDITRVTFCLPTSEIESFKSLARSQGISMTNALRKAISTELFLSSADKRGAKLLLEETDGRTIA